MPAPENSGSFLNRISIRRNQVVTMENSHEQEFDDLELFQRHVSERLSELIPSISPLSNNNNSSNNNNNSNNNNSNNANNNNDPPSSISQTDSPSSAAYHLGSPTTNFTSPLLSISWFRKLLDMFLCCEAEFKAAVVMGRDATQFCKPPLDRLIPEILDRSVKALDICNAVTQGIELVSDWQRLAQISVTALEQRPIGEGQVRRAKKALSTLLNSMMLDDKETNLNSTQAKSAERSWSFGRRVGGGGNNKDRPIGSFRSLSLSVAKSWSAAKQIQSMSANLVAPRGGEQNGLALPVYIQSTVLVFVMWALVSAVPCQERTGLATHFQLPRNLGWAQPMISLQEKIGEEWKKKEKKGTVGLLEEVQRMEKVAISLVEFADSFQFPVEDEKLEEVSVLVTEMGEICRKMEEGLVPLQQQVREVFHRIVRSRVEVLDVLDQVSKLSSPVPY